METAKERAIIAKTLILFIKSLIGSKVAVELTNGTNITGTLENVDAFMNLTLANGTKDKCKAVATDPLACDSLFIKGPRVRSVKYSSDESEIDMMKRQVESYSYRHEKRTTQARPLRRSAIANASAATAPGSSSTSDHSI